MPRGRRKQYASDAERKQAHKERMKDAGYKRLTVDIPGEYKALFDRLRKENEMTASEMFCVIVAQYEEENDEANKDHRDTHMS